MTQLQPAAIWLAKWAPIEIMPVWSITAVNPKGGRTTTWGWDANDPKSLQEMSDFIAELNGKENLYFQPNPDNREALAIGSKSKREDIGAGYVVFLDIDCYSIGIPKETAIEHVTRNLPIGMPGPCSTLIDTGGGVHAYWPLAPAMRIPAYAENDTAWSEAVHEFEMRLCGIIAAYVNMADAKLKDICRMMRLPYTYNIPNDKKRSKGCLVSLARPLSVPSRFYRLEDFPAAECPYPVSGNQLSQEEDRAIKAMSILKPLRVNLDSLEISSECKTKIDEMPGDDNSATLASIIMHLLRRQVRPSVILGVLMNDEFGVGQYVKRKGGLQHARRQLARAWLAIERSEQEQLRELIEAPR